MDIEFIRLDIHSSFSSHTVRHTNTQRSLQTHSRKFQTQVTPFLSALSNSLSLSHSFIKQIRGPNLKQIHSHCAEGTLNAVLNAFSTPFVAFSTPFVAHCAEGTLHFFWFLSRFCFLDPFVSLSPILDFGISWFWPRVFRIFLGFLLFVFFLLVFWEYGYFFAVTLFFCDFSNMGFLLDALLLNNLPSSMHVSFYSCRKRKFI